MYLWKYNISKKIHISAIITSLCTVLEQADHAG